MNALTRLRISKAEWLDESGQSITEYGAIIAFVGVLIAVMFSLAHGNLFSTICQSYSSVTSSLDALNNYSSSSSS